MEKLPWSRGLAIKSSLSPFPVPLQAVTLTQSVLEIADHSDPRLIAKADYQNATLDSWSKSPPPRGPGEIVPTFTERAAFYYLLN